MKFLILFAHWFMGRHVDSLFLPRFMFWTRYDSTALRDAKNDAHDAQIGASALFNIRTGAPAASGGNGTLLAQLVGNATAFFGASSGGVLTSNAITADSSADATGTAAHYELTTSGATWVESGVCDVGGTDGMTIDNASITAGQTVQVSGNWTKTAPNA